MMWKLLIVLVIGLAACGQAPAQTQMVEVTRVVPQTVEVDGVVPKTVEVTRVVTQVVEKIETVEVFLEATFTPVPTYTPLPTLEPVVTATFTPVPDLQTEKKAWFYRRYGMRLDLPCPRRSKV
jgi:hypothetical protein